MKREYLLFFLLGVVVLSILTFPPVSYAYSSSRRNISLDLRWGYYVMDTHKWQDRAYGRRYGIIGGARMNLDLFHQIVQLGGGIGYMREHETNYYIYNIPLEASMNIRLKFSPDQFLVPYIGGGLDYSYFKEKGKGLIDDQVTTVIRHNSRHGYHMNAGVQLLLNSFDPSEAARFDEKFGVNATYLTFEARYSDLTNFGKLKPEETDVSGWFYYMGLLFEF